MMGTFYEDFDGFAADEFPAGFTNVIGDGTVRVRADATAASADRLVEIINTGSGNNSASLVPDSISSTPTGPYQVAMMFRIAGLAVWNGGLFCNIEDAANFYMSGIFSGTNHRIREIVANSASTVNTVSFSYAVDTWICGRLERDGSTIRGKYWVPADPSDPTAEEPGSWSIVETTSALTDGLPAFGLFEGTFIEIDRAGFGDNGDPAPLTAAAPAAVGPPAFRWDGTDLIPVDAFVGSDFTV